MAHKEERIKESHIFRLHDVATLADGGDQLRRILGQRLERRRDGPGLAISAARVRCHVEFNTIRNTYPAGVTCSSKTLKMIIRQRGRPP
jgi:hypothetical protein